MSLASTTERVYVITHDVTSILGLPSTSRGALALEELAKGGGGLRPTPKADLADRGGGSLSSCSCGHDDCACTD